MLLYWHISPLAVSQSGQLYFAPENLEPLSEQYHMIPTQAASNISKLVTLPGPLVKHTHFFVCALALSSITHLSPWASLPGMASDQDVRQ